MHRFFLLLVFCLGFYAVVFYAVAIATDVGELKTHYVWVNYRGKGKPVQMRVIKQRPVKWVGVDQVSKIAVSAIVISEDDAFYQHNGYDFNQLIEAYKRDMEEHRFVRGGSTITQQVVKNVYLTGEKTLWRKVKELVLALRLEKQVGKRKILETYLNVAEFGEGLYGIGPASNYYFQKSPAELNAKEGAFLAMLLPSPKRYSISFRKRELSPFARSIIASILEKLHVTHRLTDEEFTTELARPLNFEAAPHPMLNPGLAAPEPADDEDDPVTSNPSLR